MYCNPPPPLNGPAAVNVAGFPMMATAPAQGPQPATSLMVTDGPPLMQQQQQQQQLLQPPVNMNGRVSFHDTRMEVRIASLACLSDELRNDIWYSPSDIEGMRSEARDLCRFLRVNPQACPEEHTRGLELRISLERQCRKQLTVQGVVEAQRRCTDPAYLACLAQRCSIVPRDLALAQGQRDYSNVYSVVDVNGSPSPAAEARAPDASTSSSAQAPLAAAMSNSINCGMATAYNNNLCRKNRSRNSDNDHYGIKINNSTFVFTSRPLGQPDEPFQFQPAHHHQNHHHQQHPSVHFNQCYSGQQQQPHQQQQQQQEPFCDVDISSDSDAFDPIMMEPIPFAASMPSNVNQQQHQQQSFAAFFDDGNGKRSYDNMFVAAAVEDPQDRTVRRRLEGLSGNLNI